MGFFASNSRRLIKQFKKKSEDYSNHLSKEIKEMLEDLKSDYEENSSVIPEFQDFVKDIKNKLGNSDAIKLEEFSFRLSRVNRSARNGVDAMWELSHNQRKLSAETLREYEEFE